MNQKKLSKEELIAKLKGRIVDLRYALECISNGSNGDNPYAEIQDHTYSYEQTAQDALEADDKLNQ